MPTRSHGVFGFVLPQLHHILRHSTLSEVVDACTSQNILSFLGGSQTQWTSASTDDDLRQNILSFTTQHLISTWFYTPHTQMATMSMQ